MPTKMFIITIGLGVVSIIAGLVQLILIKTSAKFRKWANKDFEKDLEVITNPKKQLELVLTFLFMLLII